MTGGTFPPVDEQDRLEKYIEYMRLWEDADSALLMAESKKINPINTRYMRANNKLITVNYYDLLVRKTQDIILNEPIKYTARSGCGISQDYLDELVRELDLTNVIRRIIGDYVAFGDACISSEPGAVYTLHPSLVYKIVDPMNIQKIVSYIVAWAFCDSYDKLNYLYIQEHHKGYYMEYIAKLKGSTIGEYVGHKLPSGDYIPKKGRRTDTFISDYAIRCIHNNQASHRLYGVSDFKSITPLVSEIALRFSLNSRTLTKNSEKSLTGPQHVLAKNPDGSAYFPQGAYIPLNQGESIQEVGTATELGDHFSQVNAIEDRLFMLAELSPALVKHTLNAPSGIAVKRLLYNTLLRTSRISRALEVFLRDVIITQLDYMGYIVKKADITVSIDDGITEDMIDMIDGYDKRISNGTITKEDAIVAMDGLTNEQASNKLEKIKGE